MLDYKSPKYDEQKKWIRRARNGGIEWKKIEYGKRNNEEGLNEFLENQREINFWHSDINTIAWKEIVYAMKKDEEQEEMSEINKGASIITDTDLNNEIYIPEETKSAWQLYKKHLKEQGFKDKVIDNIEKSTLKILKTLSTDTVGKTPIKGLVIGNVQSGKTSNMAALMAMAADWGWNMFIVLSGTIESLRQQTYKRLFNDLNFAGNVNWRGIEHPSKNIQFEEKTQNLHFEEDNNNKNKYFTVCLKNAGRLKNLIEWIQDDPNKQKQMKVLVIDDEADQAGINTKDMKKFNDERSTINKLIVNLVEGKNIDGEEINSYYKAMNYVGYTATPYANFLNEAERASLYPKDFIAALEVSKEYFGPQQIFGADNSEYNGMDIVRIINTNDLERIKDIHDGVKSWIPNSLKKAVCWFLCGTAAMRVSGYNKPISMLIHTSQRQQHHKCIADEIRRWLETNEIGGILESCEETWKEETLKFTFDKFRLQYPDYAQEDSEINRYPNFDEIKPQIKILLVEITNIQLDDDGELRYHSGIHICIDNCANNGINEEGMHVRLAYPESRSMPKPAPAFIVIGGATLSRGLTIEGLISTYFLRSVGQADTLMQMGRWFGYRKGYELIPRIWITEKTKKQFEFLSELDEDLRKEINEMSITDKLPKYYGPRVKNTPKCSLIKVTAKNRMQCAEPAEMDYSGASMQTYVFDANSETLRKNIRIVEEFVNKLGMPEDTDNYNNDFSKKKCIWTGIKFSMIKELLENYSYSQKLKTFQDVKTMNEWIDKITTEGKLTDWNIIVSGNINKKIEGNDGVWALQYGKEVNKVIRTKKNNTEDIANIGVLSNPMDVIADIPISENDTELLNAIKLINRKDENGKKHQSLQARILRNSEKAGLETTPQLIIYRVYKNSKVNVKENSDTKFKRYDLNLDEDIVGFVINIPGGKRGTTYVEKLYIPIKNDTFDDQGDLEGTDED
ncbi:Z1 domain-containing protein [Clostridium chromiireducens]|uniref:Z1 domain-containing protein n=1 Tax=Clostridium chromiireducens TaxID=225345 RepID=UPI003AF4EB35